MTEESNKINELKFVWMSCLALNKSGKCEPGSVLAVRDRAIDSLNYFESRPHIQLSEEGAAWVKDIKVFLSSFSFNAK